MKPSLSRQKSAAMTLVEVVVVIVAILLPALAAAKKKTARVGCINDVKQIGLACRICRWFG